MPKPKLKTYLVDFRIDVLTNMEIEAESLETALQKAQEFKLADVVELPGDYIDGDGVTVRGVYEL
jgi:hypothetical protein